MSRLTKFVLMVWVGLGCSMATRAQPFETLYSFGIGPANPRGNLTPGPDGNFYGTASGGQYGAGTVFRVSTNGNLVTLASFGSSFFTDGAAPFDGLTLGADGNFYGTTIAGGTNHLGGTNNTGAIFRVTTNGTLTTVASFTGFNGSYPVCKLTIGPNGSFYGTTAYGGISNVGTVFQVTTNGVLTMLASFSGTNGAMPQAGLTLGLDGNFYGTTVYGGGTNNLGTVFRVTTNGNLTTLVMFTGKYYTNNVEVFANGIRPYGQLILGTDGNLYGTTAFGGNPNGDFSGGTVFQVTTNGVLTTLIYFSAFGGINGDSSYAQLIQGADGNFYGTTSSGGVNGSGTVFQVTTNGTLAQLANLPGFQYIVVTNSQGAVYLNYTTNNWTNVLVALDLNGSVKKLYDFPPLVNSTNSTGADAQSGLTLGPDGNFYAAVYGGGTSGYGTIIRIATNGITTALASFGGNTGSGIRAGLTLGPDGSLYGATQMGGVNGVGTLFRWSPNGSLSTLHNFDYQPDGANPYASLTLGPDGNLYGTAINGGTNLVQVGPNSYNAVSDGTVFRVTTDGVFTPVVYFNGTNGANPYGALMLLGDGNFYGTTAYGGISNSGTVFQLTTNGTLTVLGSFTGTNGSHPDGKLTAGPGGNLYGTTVFGGVSNVGTVFEISTQGIINTVINFTGTNGANPQSGLLWNSDGYFYGTTDSGGSKHLGTVFKLTPVGALTTLVNFAQTNGDFPDGDLIKGPDGNIYGATSQGGTGFNGTVFRLNADGTMTTLFSFPSTPLNSSFSSGFHPYGGLILFTNGNFIHLYGTAFGGGNNGGGTIFQVNVATYYAVTENTSSLLNPLTNDLVWTTGGVLGLLTAVAANGTAQISGSGIDFTPTTNFTGTATISYTVTDNAGGTNASFITILVTNIPPVANPDFYTVVENSSANVFSPLTNDVPITSGGVLGLVSVNLTNGTAVISGTNVLFTPQANFTGTATIGYTITDNVGGTNSSLITVNVSNPLADLSLSASALPEPVGVGSNLVYSLTASNAGPSAASAVVVSNQLPAGVNFVSATGGATPSGGVLLANIGSLAVGETNLVQIVVQPTAAGKITNSFQVFANEFDPNLTNNSAAVVSTVTNAPVITQALPGTPIAWSDSGGPTTAIPYVGEAGVVVSIATHFGFVLPTWNFTTAVPGDVVLLLNPTGGNSPTNWGAVVKIFNPNDPMGTNGLAATHYETFLANNTASNGFAGFNLFTNVVYLPGTATNLAAVAAGGDAASDGEFGPVGAIIAGQLAILSYTANPRTIATITAPVPSQLVSNAVFTVTGTTTPSTVFFSATNVYVQLNGGVWTNATTANGWSNWSANVTLTPGSNTVRAYAVDNFFGTASPTNTVIFDYVPSASPSADLSLGGTNSALATYTDNLVYSLSVTNLGPNAATGVVVSNQIPAGFLFVSATDGATPTNGVLLLNLGSLAAGAVTNVTITMTPTNYVPGFLTNVFQVSANESDPVLTNNSAAFITRLSLPATVFTSSTAEYDSNHLTTVSQQLTNYSTELIAKLPNGTVVYDQTFTAALSDPTVQAAITTAAGDLTGAGAASYTGPVQTSFSQTTNNSSVTVPNGTNINVIVGVKQWVGPVSIQVGNFGVISGYTFDPVVTNYAIPTGGHPQFLTLPPGDADFDTMVLSLFDFFLTTTNTSIYTNSAVYTMTGVVAQADLKLSASAAPEPVTVGSNLVYSISITNQGPNAATGVTVSNRIPANVNFVSATGGATPAGGILLVNLGSLASNATSLAQIIVQPTSAGKLTNLFRVFASENDPALTNNSAIVVSTITNAPPAPVDVAVSITAAPNPVGVGAPLTYLVAVTNNSPTTATGVVVSNNLPPNVTLFSLLPSQGTASNHSGVVTFNVGSLSNGMAATLAIVVIPNAAGFLTNSDLAFSAQPDSQPANNSVTNVTTAVAVPITNLVLTVLSSITLNPQTGLFELRIEVANGGPSTPSSVMVLVSGLAPNATLYNATGITNGTPFVQSASPLGVGSNVIFLLEFYVPTRVAPANLTFTVQAGSPVIPPVVSGAIMNISRMIVLPDGSVLVEFSAIPGQVYAIQYSTDMVTWLTAVPAITAPATRVQWIDSGPPKTDSNPAQQAARYYRVVLLPAN